MAEAISLANTGCQEITLTGIETAAYGRDSGGAFSLAELLPRLAAIPGITLIVFNSDCIPVLLYDPKRRVIAALHAGWRGTAAGIVTKAVAQMTRIYGSNPADILAAIGPGIGKCCFETHEDVPNAMTSAMAGSSLPFIQLKENGKFAVDLKGINARRLEMAGLSPDHVDICDECTGCQPDRFWSHRRLGTQRGSMASAIQLL